jgi:hypothetical protein
MKKETFKKLIKEVLKEIKPLLKERFFTESELQKLGDESKIRDRKVGYVTWDNERQPKLFFFKDFPEHKALESAIEFANKNSWDGKVFEIVDSTPSEGWTTGELVWNRSKDKELSISENIFDKHQTKIAHDTLKMSKQGAHIMGGMNHKESINHLRKKGYSDSYIHNILKKYGHSDEEIKDLQKENSSINENNISKQEAAKKCHQHFLNILKIAKEQYGIDIRKH